MVSFISYCSISAALFAVTISSAYYTSSIYPPMNRYDIIIELFSQIIHSKIYVLACMNVALCLLISFGKFIQYLFFGNLRVSESKKLYDRSLSYTLFKIIFVGAILEPLDIPQFLVCTVWFSVLGFLKIYSLLCRDRFEYLLTTARIQFSVHVKLLSLLSIIQITNCVWLGLCVFFFYETGYSTIFLLAFECLTLFLKTSETLIRYFIHLYRRNSIWSARSTLLYYSELLTECTILIITLAHYTHIFLLHGVSLTLNAILFLHMKIVLGNLRSKVSAYFNYLKLSSAIKNQYPDLTPEQLEELDDDCAICREKMETAKKLPCTHVFHENCIRLWLENNHSCPTCRYQLIGVNNTNNENENQQRGFFGRLFRQRRHEVTQEMINAVREVAPHIPENTIRQDLQRTGSPNATLERLFIQFPFPEEEINHGNELPEIHQVSSPKSPPTDIEVIEEKIKDKEEKISLGFANSQQEREQLLKERKELITLKAQLKYMKKKQETNKNQIEMKSNEIEYNFSKDLNDISISSTIETKNEEIENLHDNLSINQFNETKKEEIEYLDYTSNDECDIYLNNDDSNNDGIDNSESFSIPFNINDSVEIRRRRAIEAAERRRLKSSS